MEPLDKGKSLFAISSRIAQTRVHIQKANIGCFLSHKKFRRQQSILKNACQ
jgi:hypothetical protein